MEVTQYISNQHSDRQDVLTSIHHIILKNDPTVEPIIEPMMGKEMIIYKAKGMMKYALSAGNKYMSLHVLPMYMVQNVHATYQPLFPLAKFQKGCINFSDQNELPLKTLEQLIIDCSTIDLVKMREDQLNERKNKQKNKKN